MSTSDSNLEEDAEYQLPPQRGGIPILGSAIQLMRDPFAFLHSLSETGDVVRYRAGPNQFTAVFHPSIVEQVLVTDAPRFRRWAFTDVGIDLAPEGVFAAEGDRWRRQRDVMQPAFTIERIGTYASVMARETVALTADWSDGDVVDLTDTFRRLTLRILGQALFNVELDPNADEQKIGAVVSALESVSGPGRNVLMLLPDWVPNPADRHLQEAIERYHTRLDGLIADRPETSAKSSDLLSILLTSETAEADRLTEREVRDNLLTFLFAGHETTSLALGYTIAALAERPTTSATIHREISEHVDGSLQTRRDLEALSTLDRVINESLRLYPPVFVMFRQAIEDAVIGGFRIPAGTVVTLPQWHIHRDHRFYDEPTSFRPDRWSETARSDRPEYAFFPFGGGPRHCIGMRFAMLELRIVLATLLRDWDFDLQSSPEPDPTAGATLRPTEHVQVRVIER